MKKILLLTTAIAAGLAGCNGSSTTASAPAASAPDAQVAAAPPADATPAPAPQPTAPLPAPTRSTRFAASPAPAPEPQYSSGYAAPQYAVGNDPDSEPPPIYTAYRPPLSQPEAIAVPWAPPPMLVEAPPPPPSSDARWTGGYWVWHEHWVWAPGRWADPPRPQYHWVPPYYEHRRDRVVFVDGFWSPPNVSFVPPPSNVTIALAIIGAGIAIGRPPVGPEGVFVPPPPGSRRGLFVMAPIGTAPAVVTGAPPIIAPGMRVTNNVTNINRTNNVHNTTIVNNNNRNTTVVNNITNVTIEAPPNSTADHRAVHVSVPAQAHLAAAQPPVERTRPVEAAPGREATPAAPPPAALARPPMAEPTRPEAGTRPNATPPNMAPPMTARPGSPARVEAAPPPDARRPGDNRKGIEPVDRTHGVTAEGVRNPPPLAPIPQAQNPPTRPGDHAAPSRTVAPPEVTPPQRPEMRGQPERPSPTARPASPAPAARPADAAKVEAMPRGEAHPSIPARTPETRPAEVRPPGRPAAPPAAAEKPNGDKAKADKPKAEDAAKEPPKKGADPRTDADKKKERDPKGELPR